MGADRHDNISAGPRVSHTGPQHIHINMVNATAREQCVPFWCNISPSPRSHYVLWLKKIFFSPPREHSVNPCLVIYSSESLSICSSHHPYEHSQRTQAVLLVCCHSLLPTSLTSTFSLYFILNHIWPHNCFDPNVINLNKKDKSWLPFFYRLTMWVVSSPLKWQFGLFMCGSIKDWQIISTISLASFLFH